MRVIATDPYRWIGFSNDPAECESWCFWVRTRTRGFYVSPRGLEIVRH